jgi:hypothetical protein
MTAAGSLVTARWRAEILEWAGSPWPESGFAMPSGRKRSAFRLLRACLGLADMARADGALKGAHADYWTRDQLAKAMGMSRKAAGDTLAWLEQNGRLHTTTGVLTTEGRQPNLRHLVLINAMGSEVNSDVTPWAMGSQTAGHGVTNGIPGGHVTLEPRGHAELGSDPSPLSSLSSLPSLEIREERARKIRKQIDAMAASKAL